LPISATAVADAAGYALVAIVIVFFGWLFFAADWTPAERRRLYAIGLLFIASVIFWSEFEQAGSTLNLFGDRSTRTEIFGWTFPSSYYQSLQPLFIITFAAVFAWIWVKLGRREPSSPAKFGLGLLFVGAGFAVVARRDLSVAHLRRTVAEPGRPQRHDQAGTGARRRPDDGCVLPGDLGRQLRRRPTRIALQRHAAADAVRPDCCRWHRRGPGDVCRDTVDQTADGRRELSASIRFAALKVTRGLY